MNKSIKYLGFAFLGSLLFFTLGALRPFIASLNGLGVSTTMSNAVMVANFRSMFGSLTNICADGTGLQHVQIIPQTANTGEFDIGDPSQMTGRYLMFSKPAGAFVIGHDGTDALRLNVANGFITLPGGGLLGDTSGETFTLNTNATLVIDPTAQLLVNGDDPTVGNRGEIFLHGTNAHIRLDVGAPIEDATAHTHLTMANGSASLDGSLNISGTGGSRIVQTASNGVGIVVWKPDFIMPTVMTNIWPTNYPVANQVLGVESSNALGFKLAWQTASGGSQTPWTSDINGGGFSLSNAFKLSLGTNGYSGTQNPSFILGGTNSAGTGVMFKTANTNGQMEIRSGTNSLYSAHLALALTAAGSMTLNQGIAMGANSTIQSSSGYLGLLGSSGIIYMDGGSTGDFGAQSAGTHKFFVGTNAEYSFWDGSSAVTAAFRSQVANTVELNNGTYGVRQTLQLKTIDLTNIVFQATNAAPAGFVVGTTVPAVWFRVTNAATPYLIPGYTP